MDVNGIGSVGNVQPMPHIDGIQGPAKTSEVGAGPSIDKVEISSAGRLLSEELSAAPDIRAERLAQIKAAIDDGTYESTDKMEAAVSRLMNEIGWNDAAGPGYS